MQYLTYFWFSEISSRLFGIISQTKQIWYYLIQYLCLLLSYNSWGIYKQTTSSCAQCQFPVTNLPLCRVSPSVSLLCSSVYICITKRTVSDSGNSGVRTWSEACSDSWRGDSHRVRPGEAASKKEAGHRDMKCKYLTGFCLLDISVNVRY